MSDLAGVRQDAVVASCGVYAGFVLGVELLRRATGARPLWLVGLLIIIDGLFLARVVNATGGTLSPLKALVYLHIVAITLVVSFRVGLEAAVWHAALVVITASEAGAALVGSSLWSVPGEVTLRVVTYLAVAVAAATYASLDERALRRTHAHLADQVDLSARWKSPRPSMLRLWSSVTMWSMGSASPGRQCWCRSRDRLVSP